MSSEDFVNALYSGKNLEAEDALVGSFLAKYKKLSTELCLKQAVEYASKVCCVRGPRLT